MRELDDGPVEPNKMAQRYEVAKGHQDPSKDIARSHIREQGLVLDHSNCIDGKEEPVSCQLGQWFLVGYMLNSLVLFLSIRCDGHE